MSRIGSDGPKRSSPILRRLCWPTRRRCYPDWSEKAPSHIARELLGRFLQDRDTRVVHDVYRATTHCAVDAIRNGTFFHFWSEVVADNSVADDLPCPRCMAT